MIGIVRGLPRFDGRSAFSTWIYRIATNAALDELRRRNRRPRLHAVDDHRQRRRRPDGRAARRRRRRPRGHRRRARATCPTTSAPPSCCATSPTSTTPRSPRSSTSRSAPSSRASPAVAASSPTLSGTATGPPDVQPTIHLTPRLRHHDRRTDDLPDDQRLLASAYLDGELSPQDRARAEADPAVAGRGRALRSVRDRPRRRPATRPGDARRRSPRLAGGGPAQAPPRPTVEARRRARWYAPLAAAARRGAGGRGDRRPA